MSFYITSLFIAIPTFVLLISLEAWIAKIKGVKKQGVIGGRTITNRITSISGCNRHGGSGLIVQCGGIIALAGGSSVIVGIINSRG